MVSQLPSHEVIRSIRFWLVTTNPLATAANTAAARTKNRAGTPETNSRAATIPMRINAVPRSWPTSTSPTVTRTIGTRNGTTTCLRRTEQLPLARQDRGADEDEPQLDELGRLELHAGQQADPVAVAVDGDAERREHQHLQRERAEQGGQGEPAVPPHRDVRRDDRADDADRGELGLVEEDAERGAVVAVGRDHRRGQDHDQADDDEDHRRSEQHVVGGDRRLQAREERQRPVQQARALGPGRGSARAVRPGLDRTRRRTGRRARHRRGPSAQRRTAASKASPRAP